METGGAQPKQRRMTLALHKIQRPSHETRSADNSPVSTRHTPPTGSSSAGTRTTDSVVSSPRSLNQRLTLKKFADDDVPSCPKCTSPSVAKIKYWMKHGAHVYACMADLVGSQGFGRSACEYWFVWQDHVLDQETTCSRCSADRSRLRIEIRAGRPGYWCLKCDSFCE